MDSGASSYHICGSIDKNKIMRGNYHGQRYFYKASGAARIQSCQKYSRCNERSGLFNRYGIRGTGEIKRSRSTRSEHRMNMNGFEKAGRWQFSQRPAFVTFLGIIIILQFFSYRMQ